MAPTPRCSMDMGEELGGARMQTCAGHCCWPCCRLPVHMPATPTMNASRHPPPAPLASHPPPRSGFNISLEPSFSVSRLCWMLAFNGVVAVANLRGGEGARRAGALLQSPDSARLMPGLPAPAPAMQPSRHVHAPKAPPDPSPPQVASMALNGATLAVCAASRCVGRSSSHLPGLQSPFACPLRCPHRSAALSAVPCCACCCRTCLTTSRRAHRWGCCTALRLYYCSLGDAARKPCVRILHLRTRPA